MVNHIFTLSIGTVPTAQSSSRSRPATGDTYKAVCRLAQPKQINRPSSEASVPPVVSVKGANLLPASPRAASASPRVPLTSKPLSSRPQSRSHELIANEGSKLVEQQELTRPSRLSMPELFTSSTSRVSPLRVSSASPFRDSSQRQLPSPTRPVFIVPPALTSSPRVAEVDKFGSSNDPQKRKKRRKHCKRKELLEPITATETAEAGTVTDWSHEDPIPLVKQPETPPSPKVRKRVISKKQASVNKYPSNVIHVTSPKFIVSAPQKSHQSTGRPSTFSRSSTAVPVADDYYMYLEREELEEIEEIEEDEENSKEGSEQENIIMNQSSHLSTPPRVPPTPPSQQASPTSNALPFHYIPRSPFSSVLGNQDNTGPAGMDTTGDRSFNVSISTSSIADARSMQHHSSSSSTRKRVTNRTTTSLCVKVSSVPRGSDAF